MSLPRRSRGTRAPHVALACSLLALSSAARAPFDDDDDDDHGGRAGLVLTATNDPAGNAVLLLLRNADGRLNPAGTFATGGAGTGAGLGNQGGLTFDEDGHRLLVVNAGSDDVSVLELGRHGMSVRDVESSRGMQPISVTQHRDLVYVLNAGGDGGIAGFHLGRRGDLEPLCDSERPLSGSGTGPAQISFTPDGKFLVVTEKATNTIVTYRMGRDGRPGDPVVSPSAGMTPFGFSFDHRGRILTSDAAGGMAGLSTVSSYEIRRDGRLETITGALSTTQSAACWLVTTPDGRFAYVTNTASSTVTGLDVDRRGRLELLESSGVTGTTGAGPIDAAISRNGRFLYVLNAGDRAISAFRIGRHGELDPIDFVDGLSASANGLAAL